MFSIFFSKAVFYEIMWKNIVEPGSSQMTIWRMRFACWVPKATNTHLEYVIRFSHCKNGCTILPIVLRYMSVACFV